MDAASPSVIDLFWNSAPAAQVFLALLWLGAVVAAAAVYAPLISRWLSVRSLRQRVEQIVAETGGDIPHRREELDVAFDGSPLATEWTRFLRRWNDAQGNDGAAADAAARAPVRLIDVFAESPVLPLGARRQLLSLVPGLLLGGGVLTTLVGAVLAPAEAEAVGGLPGAFWGVTLGCLAWSFSRLLPGGAEHESIRLDSLAQSAYEVIAPGELTTRSAHAQHLSFDDLKTELERANRRTEEALDSGLRRIENSTARAANLVSEEQRGSLRNVVEELRTSVRRGVEHHLGSLHEALKRSIEHQDAVSVGLSENYQRMLESAETHAQVTQTLDRAAGSVNDAAHSMSATAGDLQPVLDHLRHTGDSLQATAGHIDHTQEVAAHTVDTVRTSLSGAADAVREQRELVEVGLVEIRTVVELMSQGLGDQLSSALGEVDSTLARAVDQLRRTLDESNQTVDRLADPIRSAENVTRDMHQALDRVRVDIGSMSQWLVESVEPVRKTLSRIDEKSGSVARALTDFAGRAEAIEKAVESLRTEIGSEGGQLRATGNALSSRIHQAVEVITTLDRDGDDASGSRSATPRAAQPSSGWKTTATPMPFIQARPTELERAIRNGEGAPEPSDSDAADPAPQKPAPARAIEPVEQPKVSEAVAAVPAPPATPPPRFAPPPAADEGAPGAISALLGGSAPAEVGEDPEPEDVKKAAADSEKGGVDVDGPITYRQRFSKQDP